MKELPASGPFWPPASFCPKCVSQRVETAQACPTCGLSFSKVRRELLEPSAWLKEQWLNVWNDFDDAKKHTALIFAAEKSGEITDLARLYRIARVSSKNVARADKSLNELMILATQRFNASLQTDQTQEVFRRWRKYLVIALSIAVLLWVAWMLKFLARVM